MIPPRVFSVWLSYEPTSDWPRLVRHCIGTQMRACQAAGVDHKLILIEDCAREDSDSEYVRQCLGSQRTNRWAKLSDYLRVRRLLDRGGIYLDADVEVLPGADLRSLLDNRVFVGREQHASEGYQPFVGTAVVGAEPGNLLVERWLRRMTTEFRGDDELNWQSSMGILNDLVHAEERAAHVLGSVPQVRVYPADIFYPYCHERGVVGITENTLMYHHFLKSWV